MQTVLPSTPHLAAGTVSSKMKVLMVAEKPSIALAIAKVLARGHVRLLPLYHPPLAYINQERVSLWSILCVHLDMGAVITKRRLNHFDFGFRSTPSSCGIN